MGDKEAFLGFSKKKPFNYPISNLKKHFIALGSSGSGKTVLSKIFIEECARNSIPSIVVDPQGDLSSLALFGEESQILEKKIPKEYFDDFKEKVKVTIFTPISSKGVPLCINPLRFENLNIEAEEIIPILHSIATSISKLLGYDTGNDKGKSAEAILYTVLKHYYDKDESIGTFDHLADILQNLDSSLLSDIKPFIKDEKELNLLIRKIKYMGVGEKELLFQFGVPLDIPLLLGKKNKEKTQISIIYLNTLPNQDEKEFFLSILTTQLYQWMLANPSDTVQCLYFIDEIAPFIPAGSEKPMPKPILKLLFKQARKYGVACGIATQNPGDIDYKAFAQFGTWAIGRMTVKQDQKKVELALKSVSSTNISSKLPKLQPGNFLMFAPDISKSIIELNTRWLYTQHKTLNDGNIKSIMDSSRSEYDEFMTKKKKVVSQKRSVEKEDDPEIKEIRPSSLPKDPEAKIEEGIPHFKSIGRDEAVLIIESKKRRTLIIGPKKEDIVAFSTRLVPYIKATVRAHESKYMGMKKEVKEYILFFEGINGNLVKIKKSNFSEFGYFNKLLKLNDNSLKILSAVNKNKRSLSSAEISHKTSLTQSHVSKVLNDLFKKKLVSYRKVSRYFQWFPLTNINMESLYGVSSSNYITEKGTVEGKKQDAKIKIKDLSRVVRNWFDRAEIVEDSIIYLPHYVFKLAHGGKTRTIKINGANAKIIKD